MTTDAHATTRITHWSGNTNRIGTGGLRRTTMSDGKPEQWELDAILDVSEAWNIEWNEAENFLVEVGLFAD